MLKSLLLLAFVAGSWNLKWFPSGRAEHRSSPRVEAANISDAADVIRDNLKGEGRILFLQELRDPVSCSNLVATVGDTNLTVAVATAFRDFRDNRLQWQQLAIVTDLPVLKAEWKYAKRSGGQFVPRGYAFALLDGGKEGRIACYCVHLKSNYGARKKSVWEANVAKRKAMVEQVMSDAKKVSADRIVIAGDFNADRFQEKFADDRFFASLEAAGFVDCWKDAPAGERGTHPGNMRYPDSTLDYVFCKGSGRFVSRRLAPVSFVSDHRLVIVEFR